MGTFICVVLIVGLIAFSGYQVVQIVKTIRERKRNKAKSVEKENE